MTLYQRISWHFMRLYGSYRIFLLKVAGSSLGRNVKIYGRFSLVGDGRNLQLGEGTTINEGVFLNARGQISIGSHVHISPYAQIHTGSLDIQKGGIRHHVTSSVTIGNYVWIGSGAVVTQGVTIGENSVIGANSVVTNDVPPNTLVAGVPAKHIRNFAYESNSDVQ